MKARTRPSEEDGLPLDRRELLGAALLAAGRPLGVSELSGLLGLSAAGTASTRKPAPIASSAAS